MHFSDFAANFSRLMSGFLCVSFSIEGAFGLRICNESERGEFPPCSNARQCYVVAAEVSIGCPMTNSSSGRRRGVGAYCLH